MWRGRGIDLLVGIDHFGGRRGVERAKVSSAICSSSARRSSAWITS